MVTERTAIDDHPPALPIRSPIAASLRRPSIDVVAYSVSQRRSV